MAWITGFLSGLWAKIVAVGIIIGAILLAYFKIRKDGQLVQQNLDLKEDIHNAEVVTEVTKDTFNMPPGAALNELHKHWQK